MKNLVFKTFLVFVLLFGKSQISNAQSTDFTMSYDSTGACGDTSVITVQVWASGILLWSGRPSYGRICISGGTPTDITIIDGSCNSFNFPVNAGGLPVLQKSGNLCIFSCLKNTTDNPPTNYYGFYATYVNTGGVCATPFVSGLLTLTMYPFP